MYESDTKIVYYEKLLNLYSHHIGFTKIILDVIQDTKCIIYGNGVLGKMICEELSEKKKEYVIFDKKFTNNSIDENGMYYLSLKEIYEADEPIIITPLLYSDEIVNELLEIGVDRKRLYPLGMLIDLCYDRYEKNIFLSVPENDCKYFLITGAQFHNIGAQSMLFVAVNELRKRYTNCVIYYLPVDDLNYYSLEIRQKYNFNIIKEQNFCKAPLRNILTQIDAIIDVSGYALSSNWNVDWYVDILKIAEEFFIPLFLMPQSFGPFDFVGNMGKKIAHLLFGAKIIFAREHMGYELLTKQFGLPNIEMSIDMVLENKGIEEQNIYLSKVNHERVQLNTKNNVGIVPNYRNSTVTSEDELLLVYKIIIDKLLNIGKNIYIFSGAEDEELCGKIYAMFREKSTVHLCIDRRDCMEYSEWLENFDFLVASRFHTIVHAYKKGVPCIIMGWAEKYKELAEKLGQEKYVFDVREGIEHKKIILRICEINKGLDIEKKIILERLLLLQQESCFDSITL